MVMANLANCVRCDVLFVRGVRDVCPKCYQEIEKEYEKVAQFLRKRENRGSTIHQVSDATGVSVKQITRFIKDGRISVAGTPNLGYPCEQCGEPIRTGNMCESCMRSLKREINQQLDVDRRLSEEEQHKRNITYQRKKTLE
ncbi:TIGR03826 family flagellar region protein [Brevibacillus dissolubilis]|uniref:TIGR03826 family flagellar region protein n=1 Tax=Brevibacillus dissolubilis TaxID=1844116 RepID=UPI001116C819|nr:TIGR03826 family flagellar region protein [Brevibacillus dissolubilis]